MFGSGGLGGILPAIGMLGSAFSGGGLFGLGFSLLSGLLSNVMGPRNPGFSMDQMHPGFADPNLGSQNPGFPSLFGGPSASTVGSMNGYFGNGYSMNGYPSPPPTSSGQYHANANYSFGSHGVDYGQASTLFGPDDYRNNVANLQLQGDPSQYQNRYQQIANHPAHRSDYQASQHYRQYGSAPAPYSQSIRPATGHYTLGGPQQYNPASTLYGHQNGSIDFQQNVFNYQPHFGNGGPVHHHHHHHHHHYPEVPATTPPVEPPVVTDPAVQPPTQTSWPLVPPVGQAHEWAGASNLVRDRITGTGAERYIFGGRDPRTHADGMGHERVGAWHVFQQNETLRLDTESGMFYETKSDGTTDNKFHISAVADIQRSTQGDWQRGAGLINDFLRGHNLAAPGVPGNTNQPMTTAPEQRPASQPGQFTDGLGRTFPGNDPMSRSNFFG